MVRESRPPRIADTLHGPERSIRAAQFALLLVLLISWELVVSNGFIKPYVISQPSKIATSLVESFNLDLLRHASITVVELVTGLVVGGTLGIGAAILVARFKAMRDGVNPLVLAAYTVPRLALVPLLIVWFGFGMTAQIFVASIHGFVLFYLAMSTALDSIPKDIVAALRSMGGRPIDVHRFISFPFSVAHLVATFRQSLGLALGSVVVAEMIGPLGGLGYLLAERMLRFDVAGVVALMLITALIAVALDVVASAAERKLTQWKA